MRKFIVSLILVLVATIAFTPRAEAQKYSFGDRTSVSLTSATAIALAPASTMTVYTLEADTNVAFTISTSAKSIIGDMVVLKLKALTLNRTFTFSGNIVVTSDTLTASKTKLFLFIYTGSKYEQLSEVQID